MGELAPEFKQKIAHFDGDSKLNKKEEDIIFYVEAYARNMPPDYLNKLIEAIKIKLRDREFSKTQIGIECGKAIKELNEKIESGKEQKRIENQTIGDKALSFVEQNLFSKIYRYTEGMESEKKIDEQIRQSKIPKIKKISIHPELKTVIYQAIEVTVFEKEIKTTSPEKINSNTLANYFTYLHNTHLLSPELLIQKFGGDALIVLGTLWQKGGTDPIAYTTLKNNGLGYIVDTIVKLSFENDIFDHIKTLKDPKQQETVILLLQEKESSLKEKFKKELKTELMTKNKTMAEDEASKIVNELLVEILNHKGISGLPKIYKAFDDYSKKYGVPVDVKKATEETKSIKRAEMDVNRAKLLKEGSEIQDTKKLKDIDRKLKQQAVEVNEEKMAARVNEKMQESDIQDLVSRKKKIDDVIEEFKKEDKIFAKEYKTLEKERENLEQENPIKGLSAQEKEDAENTSKKIPDFTTIKNGQTEQINIGTQGSGNTTGSLEASITKVDDTISVKIGQQDSISLSKEQYPAYMESIIFLQETGLGYLAKNLSPKDLQSIFRATSQLGNTNVDNQDSTFGKEEQRLFLKNISHVLGIDEGMAQTNTEDMKDYVRGKLQEKSFENRASSLGKDWFKNQTIHEENFSQALKST